MVDVTLLEVISWEIPFEKILIIDFEWEVTLVISGKNILEDREQGIYELLCVAHVLTNQH